MHKKEPGKATEGYTDAGITIRRGYVWRRPRAGDDFSTASLLTAHSIAIGAGFAFLLLRVFIKIIQ